MPARWKTKKIKSLVGALLSIKNQQDMLNFLRDLCTLEELQEISSRWQVVQMLNQGMPYRQISQKTGVSTTTVTRIAYWLKHGQGGYDKVLKKISKQKK